MEGETVESGDPHILSLISSASGRERRLRNEEEREDTDCLVIAEPYDT